MEENNKVLDVVFLPESGEYKVILPEIYKGGATATEPEKKYVFPRFSRSENVSAMPWASWGQGDDMPLFIYHQIMSLPLAAQAIRVKVKDALGAGIQFVDEKAFFNGEIVPKYVAEEADFREVNRIETDFLPNQLESNELFANAFSQLDFSADKKKINRIFHWDTTMSRLSKQSLKTWRIEYAMFSGKFASYEMPKSEDITTYPLYRWYDPNFFNWLNGSSMVFHAHLPTPGMTYYARQTWLGMLKEGTWFDVARNVPAIVAALQQRVHISYQLIISDLYMKLRYGYESWAGYTDEEKFKKYEEVAAKAESKLKGAKNAGAILINFAKEEGGEMHGQMRVEAITDPIKAGSWIPDSAVANSEILNALGLHPSQMGLMNEGGKMGAGSGSDARVHFNSGIYRNTLEQKIALEPLNLIAKYNKWGGRYVFKELTQVQTSENKTGLTSPPAPKGGVPPK